MRDPSAERSAPKIDIKKGSHPSPEKKAPPKRTLPYIDNTNVRPPIHYKDFQQQYAEEFNKAKEIITNAQSLIPKDDKETQSQYERRVMQEIKYRLYDQGSYDGKDDKIFDYLQNNIDPGTDEDILMGVEAHEKLLIAGENEKIRQKAQNNLGKMMRRDVRGAVSHAEPRLSIEGPYYSYFAEDAEGKPVYDEEGNLKKNREPKADLYSMTLVADRLLDVADPATQEKGTEKPKTYREQMKNLEDVLNSDKTSEVEKTAAAKNLVSVRSQFYSMMIEALESLDQPQYVNADSMTNVAKDQVLIEMHAILKEVRTTIREKGVDGLISQYKGVQTGLRDSRLEEMRNLLKDQKMSMLDFALKGADLMRRRISVNKEIPDEDDGKIYFKRKVQAPKSLEEAAEGDDKEPVVVKPPKPEPVPIPVPKPEPKEPPVVIPAPVIPKEPPVVEPPEPVEPAPKPEPEPPEPVKPPKPPEPVPQPEPIKPPTGLVTEVNMAAVALQNRAANNAVALGKHYFAEDIKKIGVPPKIPLFGGILWGIRHPIKAIWQNAILRTVFEMQHTRFGADFENIIKDRVGSRSIPMEVSNSLMDTALEEGRALRGNDNIVSRGLWKAWDLTLNGLFGIGQNSEQVFAKRWLRGIPRHRWEERMKVSTSNVLKEQTELGQRFADTGKLTLVEANRLLDRGESRYQLPPDNGAVVNQRIKGIIERYAGGALNEDQLVREINTYFLSNDFRNQVPANLRNEMNAPEVATNILNIANDVKGNWNRYRTEQGEDGKTKWEEFKVNILFGRGEWGGVRGGTESGFLVENLARRLVNRESRWYEGRGLLAGAVGLAKDVITFGGGYAAGWVASGAMFGTSTLARTVGGAVGVSAVAALKETGFRVGGVGWKGRYAREVSQLSREAALGRGNPAGARIREEMARALVNREKATDLVQKVEGLLAKEQFTDAEARQLLGALAGIDARMRLTNLSNTGQLGYMTQNFIEFTEGQENEEYRRLKSALLNGLVHLRTTPFANAQWSGIQYRPGGQQQLGNFDKYSAIAEAQLRNSTNDEQMRNWLRRDLRLSNTEINSMMTDVFPDADLNIARENSLRSRESTLRTLTLKRGGAMFIRSMVAGGLASAGWAVVAPEVGSFIKEGFDQHIRDWGEVLKGNVPVRPDIHGRPVVDLTPIQKGVLMSRAVIEPPHWPPQDIPLHYEKIDGVDVNLSHGIRHGTLAGGNDYLVDVGNGRLYDLSDYHFDKIDLNGDGKLDLALVYDRTGEAISVGDPTSPLREFGVTEGNPVTDTREQVLLPDNNKLIKGDITLPGGKTITTQIPEGTRWQQDGSNWDLVVDNGPGKGRVLINDATFDSSGKLVSSGAVHSALEIKSSPGGPPEMVKGPAASAEWEKMGTKIDKREWYSYDLKGSQGNELRLHTIKDGDAVILDMSKMGIGKQTGLNPNPINVQDVIKNGQAGMALSVPGFSDKPVWISDGADGVVDGKVRIDFNDNLHKVQLPDGRSVSMSEIGNMLINKKAFSALQNGDIATELNNKQEVFNLGDGKKMGFIEAGRMVQQDGQNVLQAFATIRGSGGLSIERPGEGGFPIIDLKESIKETTTVTTSTFDLRPPTFDWGDNFKDFIWIPLPMRQNIERSVGAGEVPPETADQPKTQPSGTPKPPQQVPTKPLTPAEEKKKKELEKKVKELEAVPEEKRSDKQKKELEEKKRELAEMEEKIKKEEIKEEGNKNEYFEFKEKMERTIKEDIEKVNKGEMTEEDFKGVYGVSSKELTADGEREKKVKEIYKREKELELRKKITEEEVDAEMSNEEKAKKAKYMAIVKESKEKINMKELNERVDQEAKGKSMAEKAVIIEKVNEEYAKKAGINYQEYKNLEKSYKEIIERVIAKKMKKLDEDIARWEAEVKPSAPQTPAKTAPATGANTGTQTSSPPTQEAASTATATHKEEEKEKFKEKIREEHDSFEEMANKGEIQAHNFGIDSSGWQGVVYGRPTSKHTDDLFRGYLMIELEDMPKALEILKKVGAVRKKRNDRLDFKWLTLYSDEHAQVGDYDQTIKSTHPRVAIYGDSEVEVSEVLKMIADDSQWQEIEENRTKKYQSGKSPRRPGTNAFTYKGKEYRSINYNNKPGYSEDEAADPNWREKKIGDKTLPIIN